ncbi:hypothetical protein ACFL26_00530 [Patescibacteria group bacterium]
MPAWLWILVILGGAVVYLLIGRIIAELLFPPDRWPDPDDDWDKLFWTFCWLPWPILAFLLLLVWLSYTYLIAKPAELIVGLFRRRRD